MKRQTLFFLISLLPAFCLSAEQIFSDTYGAFKQAVKNNEPEKALVLSEQVLTLGKQQFGEESNEAAVLTLSHGNILVMNQRYDEAFEYYDQTESLYEALYGDESVAYVEALVTIQENLKDSLQHLSSSHKAKKKSLLKRLIIVLADGDLATKAYAGVYHRAALAAVTSAQIPVLRGTLVRFVNNAVDAVAEAHGNDDLRTTETRYISALAYHSANKREAAIDAYERVIAWIDKQTDFSHPYVLSSHAKLVELYEEEGLSDKATEHCIAIGSMTPWDPDQDAEPLYRKDPEFPVGMRNQIREGSAKLSFDIDEQGFVKNIRVDDVTGGSRFGHSAKRALEHWRYAPKFEQGEPVVAKNNKVQIDYRID